MFNCLIKMEIIPSTTGRNDLFWNIFLPIFDPYGISLQSLVFVTK